MSTVNFNSGDNGHIHGEQMQRKLTEKEMAEKYANRAKQYESKDFENHVHAALNDTEAAVVANSLADMEIDVKMKDGKTVKEKVISGTAFNQYVREHYPNVEFNEVKNYISIADATGSFTQYEVRQKTYEAAQQKAALQGENDNCSAPEMGV